MRVHNVILITSGAGELCSDGTIDRVIRQLTALKKSITLVIGPEGDDLLRSSQLAESCELVFDPNYDGQLFSGIKAGLYSVGGSAFVLPLKAAAHQLHALCESTAWQELERELIHPSLEIDVILPLTHEAEVHELRFPQLVTPRGSKTLLRFDAQTEWLRFDQIKTQVVAPQSPPPAEANT